ncbi:MAG: glycine oxidase ThiO [Gemmatimonadota bacterium]
MSRNGTDPIVVIGGGIMGSALARELAVLDQKVVLLEAGLPGRQASWAAAGMLAPLGEAPTPGPFLDLARASLELFPTLLEELLQETGQRVPYAPCGKLQVAWSAEEVQDLRDRLAWAGSMSDGVGLLTGADLRRQEPLLSPNASTALLIPHDHQVENRELTMALWEGARRHGVDARSGFRVTGVESTHGRVSGVRLADGDLLKARAVVVAAGAWSGGLNGLPTVLPVRPVKGQMLALDARGLPPIRRILASSEIYLVPREDGRLLVGATVEEAGFDMALTPQGIMSLLDPAIRLLPAAGNLPILEFWSGLRPGTPDDLPILGPDPHLQGLWYATGHFRNGILLAPGSSRALARAMTGEVPEMDLRPFHPHRFVS